MTEVLERVNGRIVDYDERTGELTIKARYDNLPTMFRRGYKDCTITLNDSRKLSHKQRRSCYAMIREVAEYAGEDTTSEKEFLKLEFWTSELYQTADSLFSLSDAPMSVVAAFQSWLARFIVHNDIPTRVPMLDYVDDVQDYVYACLASKKCCICGGRADLHHVDRIGMGRDRTDVIHEGLKVLPLCRKHHEQAHTMPDEEFFNLYHLKEGIEADKTICKIYGLKKGKTQ